MGVSPILGLILEPVKDATGVSYNNDILSAQGGSVQNERCPTPGNVSSSKSLDASYPSMKLTVSIPCEFKSENAFYFQPSILAYLAEFLCGCGPLAQLGQLCID